MSTLSILLPPCSPDYSGVASVLYELGGMVVLHDASGCTGNYLGYDEPRWIDTRSLVYCSGLRHIDAVLGRDDKLVSRVVAAAESFHPAFIAIIGSPVPMLVGTDYQGIAREIEAKTGIPSFGFDTTGLDFYDKGVVMATKELLKRFAPRTNHYQQIPHTINIVGATPLDWGNNGNITACRSFFAQNGIQVTCCLSMSCTLDDIKQAPTAALNVAVSEAGIQIAEFMENEYHIPYVVGIPLGDGSRMLQKVRTCLAGKTINFGIFTQRHNQSTAHSDRRRTGPFLFPPGRNPTTMGHSLYRRRTVQPPEGTPATWGFPVRHGKRSQGDLLP
ncbi:MAG: hypothetical protein LKE39_00405 [Sphaerochaeta sp.]|jgi:nitrogenase molybdenum-iron protein alpha/beta subunit|nr:hypothetical protein [Sphaerochaeta sp.]